MSETLAFNQQPVNLMMARNDPRYSQIARLPKHDVEKIQEQVWI